MKEIILQIKFSDGKTRSLKILQIETISEIETYLEPKQIISAINEALQGQAIERAELALKLLAM